MRLRFALVAPVVVSISSAALAADAPASSAVAALRTQYLDGLFRSRPHLATFMGEHKYDGELPDLSPAATDRRKAELLDLQKQLGQLKLDAAALDAQIDAAILRDGIGLELLYLQDIREWTWNPRLYDSFPHYDPREIVGARLSDLIHGTFAPEAERRKSVKAQLLALPKFLAQQKAALEKPSKVHLEQAIKDNKGRIEFFNTDVKKFTQPDAASESARQGAVKALQDYQAFLEKSLPKATRDWRLGAELYAKKFPLALQTDLTPRQVVVRAEQAFKSARQSLLGVAVRLHQQLWPKQALSPATLTDSKTQADLIRKVRDEISKDHPTADQLVDAHAAKLDKLRAFIEQKDLLALPPKETLRVEPMPLFKRGASGAEYLSPGMLDKVSEWRGTYYVDPVDPTWPAAKVESYLRANNDYEVELTAIHEAYPGHHTQAWYSRRDLNPLRATLWSGPMAEGWAVYCEALITRLGYGMDKADRYMFNRLKGDMIVSANALLDVKLQSGEMTDEEAIRFMVDEGFQEQTQAEKKLLRAKLDSTQLVQYFLGYSEIRDLERDAQRKWGAAFTQRKFDEGLVGHGSIAVKYLRPYVLDEKLPAAPAKSLAP